MNSVVLTSFLQCKIHLYCKIWKFLKICLFFFLVRTFKFYSLSKFKLYNTVLSTTVTIR